MLENAVGRVLPASVEGYGPVRGFAGAFATPATPGCGAARGVGSAPPGHVKVQPTLRDALEAAGLCDGMTLSFHHHLREGDGVVNRAMQTVGDMGVSGITLAPTILFNVHEPLVELVRDGVIRTVHGCMNGPLGRLASEGGFAAPAVLRSHGARARAIGAGELSIDIAIIAASAADPQGNATGLIGPNAFGPMAFSRADAMHARKVIVVTDHLVDYPLMPFSIAENEVDYVVEVDSIGDAAGIVSGVTRIADREPGLSIARMAAEVLWQSGLVRDRFNFQAGAGGISLATVQFLGEIMQREGVRAAWANGGIHEHVLKLFHAGLVEKVLNCQAFDIPAVRSLRDDPTHVEIDMDHYANIHGKGCLCHQLDAVFLGGTEIDTDFNVNANTHSDGYLLHAIGGHQDTASGAKLTVITAPLTRKTHPIIVDRCTTVTTPGEVVDVVVTDIGVAINPRSPRHEDLADRLGRSDLPLVSIEQMREEARRRLGNLEPAPELTDRIIAVLEWRDGTVLDVIRQVRQN